MSLETGALGWPNAVGSRVTNQIDKLNTAGSYRTDGPWQDKNEVIRGDDFVGRALDRNEDTLARLPGIDPEAVRETSRRHPTGEMNVAEELYRLSASSKCRLRTVCSG